MRCAHLINVSIYPVVENQHHQQLLDISLRDVELLGHKGDANARVGLYELQHNLQMDDAVQYDRFCMNNFIIWNFCSYMP